MDTSLRIETEWMSILNTYKTSRSTAESKLHATLRRPAMKEKDKCAAYVHALQVMQDAKEVARKAGEAVRDVVEDEQTASLYQRKRAYLDEQANANWAKL